MVRIALAFYLLSSSSVVLAIASPTDGPSWELIATTLVGMVVGLLVWVVKGQITRIGKLEEFRDSIQRNHLDKDGVQDAIKLSIRLVMAEQIQALVLQVKTEIREEMQRQFDHHEKTIREKLL